MTHGEYPNSLKRLSNSFRKLPGIGEKTAERLAFSVRSLTDSDVEDFLSSLSDVKKKIKNCNICNNLSEEDVCPICSDETRKNGMLCIVEDTKNVILFERTGAFDGKYHILNGLISPINGINPEDININSLIKRVKEEEIREVIIAVKPTIDGETTALYIQKMLDGLDVVISKIAHGVPIGSDMEYLDSLTLEMALSDRKKISNN